MLFTPTPDPEETLTFPFVEFSNHITENIDSGGKVVSLVTANPGYTSIVTSLRIVNNISEDIAVDILIGVQQETPGEEEPTIKYYDYIISRHIPAYDSAELIEKNLSLSPASFLIAKSHDDSQRFSAFCQQEILKTKT